MKQDIFNKLISKNLNTVDVLISPGKFGERNTIRNVSLSIINSNTLDGSNPVGGSSVNENCN